MAKTLRPRMSLRRTSNARNGQIKKLVLKRGGGGLLGIPWWLSGLRIGVVTTMAQFNPWAGNFCLPQVWPKKRRAGENWTHRQPCTEGKGCTETQGEHHGKIGVMQPQAIELLGVPEVSRGKERSPSTG